MSKEKIMIPSTLFSLMVSYINDHYDASDSTRFRKIQEGINEKRSSQLRHTIYTLSKVGKDPAVREQARQYYLDLAGIPEDFRWQMPEDPACLFPDTQLPQKR